MMKGCLPKMLLAILAFLIITLQLTYATTVTNYKEGPFTWVEAEVTGNVAYNMQPPQVIGPDARVLGGVHTDPAQVDPTKDWGLFFLKRCYRWDNLDGSSTEENHYYEFYSWIDKPGEYIGPLYPTIEHPQQVLWIYCDGENTAAYKEYGVYYYISPTTGVASAGLPTF